jgi:hypothetical protein
MHTRTIHAHSHPTHTLTPLRTLNPLTHSNACTHNTSQCTSVRWVRVLLTVTALSVLMSVRSNVSGGPLSDLLAQRAIIEEFNHGCDLTQVYTNTTGCAECVPGSSQSWVGSHFSSSVYVSTYECVCVYMGVCVF